MLDLPESPMPSWTPPMLASPHDEPFSREGWIFERKLDGVRVLVFRKDGRVRVLTRNRKDRSGTYFELREALEAEGGPDLIADGEVVVLDGDRTSFSLLQTRMQVGTEGEARRRARRVPVTLFLFDLLYFDRYDLTGLPLVTRKRVLRERLQLVDPVHYLPHVEDDGLPAWRAACARGWEGLIAKDGDSVYRHARSTRWLKLKCVSRQEVVVGGFTEPEGAREGFGALLVGTYEGGSLVYAGKVGTGYDHETLRRLRARLEPLEQAAPPFAPDPDLPTADVHWVAPRLVAEVGFSEWTDSGRLRHPRYLGLRTDKEPEDVVREVAP